MDLSLVALPRINSISGCNVIKPVKVNKRATLLDAKGVQFIIEEKEGKGGKRTRKERKKDALCLTLQAGTTKPGKNVTSWRLPEINVWNGDNGQRMELYKKCHVSNGKPWDIKRMASIFLSCWSPKTEKKFKNCDDARFMPNGFSIMTLLCIVPGVFHCSVAYVRPVGVDSSWGQSAGSSD